MTKDKTLGQINTIRGRQIALDQLEEQTIQESLMKDWGSVRADRIFVDYTVTEIIYALAQFVPQQADAAQCSPCDTHAYDVLSTLLAKLINR